MSEIKLGDIKFFENEQLTLSDCALDILILVPRNDVFKSMFFSSFEFHTKIIVASEIKVERAATDDEQSKYSNNLYHYLFEFFNFQILYFLSIKFTGFIRIGFVEFIFLRAFCNIAPIFE